MSYLGRFFRWLIDGIIHIIHDVIIWGIRQTISFIRFGWPYFWMVVFSALGLALQLSVMNVLALVKGASPVAEQAGADWSYEAVRRGFFPSLHQPVLTRILTILAYLAIYIGFLVNVFTLAFTISIAYKFLVSR